MDMPKVVIIILNWNGWKDTIECLESIFQTTYLNRDVIVVDNGSEDESVKKIKEYCEGRIEVKSRFFKYDPNNKPIKVIEYTRKEVEDIQEKEFENQLLNGKIILIKNEKNYGFAKGNNIGMKYALKILKPDYILLLNNDVVVSRNFLEKLVSVSENDDTIGIVGPKVYFYDEPDKLWFAGGKIYWFLPFHFHIGFGEKDIKKYDEERETEFLTGTCMLIKRDVIAKIGLLPTEYYMQYEDLDFCQCALRNGFRILYCPTPIWHKISASYKKYKLNFFQIKMSFRNSIIFYNKYLSKARFIPLLFSLLFIKLPLFSIYNFIKTKKLRIFSSILNGVGEGLQFLIHKNERKVLLDPKDM